MDRRKFKSSEIEKTWDKAATIPGTNPDKYRQDKSGNAVYYSSYGKTTTMGWDVDHSKPLAKGGTYHPNNLQVLQAEENRYSKNANYPYDYSSEKRGVGYTAPSVDLRSSAVKSGELYFKPDGTVDKHSPAVRSGDVLVTSSGQVDMRSSAVKQGDVNIKPSW